MRAPLWRARPWTLFVVMPGIFCAWATFLYIGVRARHRPWQLVGVAYLVATIGATWAAQSLVHGELALTALCLGGIVHGIVVKPRAENRLEVIDRFRHAGAYR